MNFQDTAHGGGGSRLGSWVAARLRALRLEMQSFPADHPLAGSFRAEQLQAVLRLTPLTMLANVVNASLICMTFWYSANPWTLAGWTAMVLLVVVQGFRAWRKGPRRHSASPRALRRAVWHASALAALWGAVPVMLLPGAMPPEQLLIATITAGMICAGGFALATVPKAATAYVLILSSAGVWSLARAGFPLALAVSLLVACYGLIVLASVWSNARLFVAHLMAKAEADRHHQVIGLLLRDFEEHASDLLWEVDTRGHLCHVSARLLEAFRQPLETLATAPAIELLAELQHQLPEDQRGHLAALRLSLDRGLPFKDLLLPLPASGKTRWWSLTAKPLLTSDGQPAGWRGVATDITEARRANSKLTFLAHYDALTGLANRHQLRAQLADLLTPGIGPAQPCALLCLDLDHFKTINDTLGHAVGDRLLQEMAKRLLASIRLSDTAGRLGGDEFVVICSK